MTAISLICENMEYIKIVKGKTRMEPSVLIRGVKLVYPQEKPADNNASSSPNEQNNGTENSADKEVGSQTKKKNETSKRSLDSSSPSKIKKLRNNEEEKDQEKDTE